MWLPPTPLEPIEKSQYKIRVQTVRSRLLQLQHTLRSKNFPVLVVFAGVDGGGKHETINQLSAWLDPRYVQTLAYSTPSQEESERPRMWRYWRDLPVRGQVGLVMSGWYSQPLIEFARHRSDQERFTQELNDIYEFESMLAADGALILKFWMHLSAEQQHKRLSELADNPNTIWQTKPQDWENLKLYKRFVAGAEQMLDLSHRNSAPWDVIDGNATGLRSLLVAEKLADALEQRLAATPKVPKATFAATKTARLGAVDMGKSLDKNAYNKRLEDSQTRLVRLQHHAMHLQRPTIVVLEGWDAAGKGGAIRRLVRPLDARQYKLIPIAAPNDEELARHYLWRFWRHLPRPGHLCVFDRSWYGRVLVERAEGFAKNTEWQRAYSEIRGFEKALTEHGIRIVKFWVHLSPEEQLARFRAREKDPLKNWKITDEDWRNREQWPAYVDAVEDMLELTSTPAAPWHVIPGNDKRYSRVKILETVCDAMSLHA